MSDRLHKKVKPVLYIPTKFWKFLETEKKVRG